MPEHFVRSLEAFRFIQSYRQACAGGRARTALGTAGAIGALSSGMALASGVADPSKALKVVLGAFLRASAKAQMDESNRAFPSLSPQPAASDERTAFGARRFEQTIEELRAKADFRKREQVQLEIERLARKARNLRRFGAVGLVLSAGAIGVALAVDSNVLAEWLERAERFFFPAGSRQSGDSISHGGSAPDGVYASSPKMFLARFLELRPEEAQAYLARNEQLRELTIGFASYLVSLTEAGGGGELESCQAKLAGEDEGAAEALIAAGKRN
jgi:hypothetical protein